jgi:3D-(3,5/4)-trihydroxycyclohexane-1,2-dione acylhydrolase (decyclizing)
VVADAGAALEALTTALDDYRAPEAWSRGAQAWMADWDRDWAAAMAAPANAKDLPSDAQVVGAVWREARGDAVVVGAAGGLPGELHRLWRPKRPGGYHLEYGFSCMGYEIAGGLGVKMADPRREVIVMVGDGSYLMLNSEIATSVMLGLKLTIVLLDNRGFGCINRLQASVGAAPFNNLFENVLHDALSDIDFVAHAASLGAIAERVADIGALEAAVARAAASPRTHVIVIETDPARSTEAGGAWWDVAVPEVSESASVARARAEYDAKIKARSL